MLSFYPRSLPSTEVLAVSTLCLVEFESSQKPAQNMHYNDFRNIVIFIPAAVGPGIRRKKEGEMGDGAGSERSGDQ